MELFLKYVIAMVYLYGIILIDKAVEIYNGQNDNLSPDDVDLFLSSKEDELDNAFVYIHRGCFVHEVVLEFDEFEELLAKKGNKPYYIPEKEELLKYTDEFYIEKNKQYYEFLEYIKKNFYNENVEKAEVLCEEIHGLSHSGAMPGTLINEFNKRDIVFDSQEQVNEVLGLLMEFSNSIRLWGNNGHTPKEIFERYEKPALKPLPEKPFVIRNNKTGRNEPCPCKSGKKYKNCCLGKTWLN